MLWYVTDKEVKEIIIKDLKSEGLCYIANKYHSTKEMFYYLDLAFYPVVFYN